MEEFPYSSRVGTGVQRNTNNVVAAFIGNKYHETMKCLRTMFCPMHDKDKFTI